MGERLIVQFARGSRARNENFTPNERVPPRPRRTPYRMRIANLPVETTSPWTSNGLSRVLPVTFHWIWTRLNLAL
jgi:hypothetical protein